MSLLKEAMVGAAVKDILTRVLAKNIQNGHKKLGAHELFDKQLMSPKHRGSNKCWQRYGFLWLICSPES